MSADTGISPQVYIVLGTAIITAAVTLLSGHLAHRGQLKLQNQQFKRDSEEKSKELRRNHLERIYKLYTNWAGDLTSLQNAITAAREAKLTELEAIQIAGDDRDSTPPQFEELNMLIRMYVPELNKPFIAVLMERDRVGHYLRPGHMLDPGHENSVIKFKKASDDFKQSVAELAGKL